MNDFLVSFLTIVSIFAILYIRKPKDINKIKYRQSHIHQIIGPFLPDLVSIDVKNTQSKKHLRQNTIDVLITENAAYWIHNNVFYRADAENGRVDRSTASPVITENMPEEEVKKMLIILDKLTARSKDEGRGTGNKRV